MAEETITILRVGTDEAVKSVNDLKNNVKILKEQLGDLEIGTEEYQHTLDELKVNQAAVKDAMYATTSSMEDLAKSATGTSESYNSLVHRMAALKEELRATDVSTEQGRKRFAELAGQVDDVNSKLKAMDALQGNFQRNVGNYQSAFKGLGEKVDGFGKGLKALQGSADGAKGALDAMSKTPALVITGMLVSAVTSLVSKFKETEEGTQAIQASLVSLEPIMLFFKGVFDSVVDLLGETITKVGAFLGSSGLMQKITNAIVGVGNAIMQYVIAPFKGVARAIGIFKEQGVKGLGDAAKAFGEELKNGVSFKKNYESGQQVAETIISGARAKRDAAKAEGVELGKQMGEGIKKGLQLADWQKALAEGERKTKEREDVIKAEQDMIDEILEESYAENLQFVEDYFAEEERLAEENRKRSEEIAKAKVATLKAVAGNMADILGSMADLYESDDKNAEKYGNRIKNLRVASATIDTISGAIGAFMQAVQTIPPPYGMITGGIQAAAVTAAGIAQIAKIRNTKVSGSASNSVPSAPAVTTAPTMSMDIPQMRTITSASEEDRLNQMASEQRVVLVMSDLELKQNQSKVQLAEATF